MSRKSDPAQLLTLRKQAIGRVNARFNAIKRVIRETIVDNDALLIANDATAATGFVFSRDVGLVDEFMLWLSAQIESEILMRHKDPTKLATKHWLTATVGNAYERGATKAQKKIKAGNRLAGIPATSPLLNQAHIDRAELVYTRVFTGLEGVTTTMQAQIRDILGDGVMQGKNSSVIAREINTKVDKIGKVRSRLIARTEVNRAYNEAVVIESDALGASLGEEIKFEWTTADDGKERPSHHERHEQIYGRNEALSLIGEPNCRCAITPYFDI